MLGSNSSSIPPYSAINTPVGSDPFDCLSMYSNTSNPRVYTSSVLDILSHTYLYLHTTYIHTTKSTASAGSPRSAMSSDKKKKGNPKGRRVTIVEADYSSSTNSRPKRNRMFKLIFNYCQLSSVQVCIVAGAFVCMYVCMYVCMFVTFRS